MPLLAVDGDPVEGTDTHTVQGTGKLPNGTPTLGTWTGSFTYTGSMTDALSDFVSIGGDAVAVTSSASSLDPGEDIPPTGGHSGPKGTNFKPLPPVPEKKTLFITDPIGTGTPGSAAGSGFVRIGGDPVLLDGDPIDTCDGTGATGNSSVTASTQDFVTASE